MSYQALYRKWRPDEFEEVKGQEHIVKTIKNQIVYNRIAHAYLFCGTRGTGKTTVAKLFAKAVNCEHPVDGSPCNECASCKAIQSGSSLNVIEIDAASNNGVDNIREIKEQVQYSPTGGKYKVYIIDEVHMLSIGAFNALLKTLEEPPSYVIFILATTEAHKIPITILSRCQKYDFRRISIDTISDRLNDLMVRENISVEDKAIRYIAKVADGSMRDALSLLDQCIAFYLGKELTYENVLEVLGAVDLEVYEKLLRAIINGDTLAAIDVVDDCIWQGKELTQFVTDFTWYLRNILLIKSSEDAAKRLDISADRLKTMTVMSEDIEFETLFRYIRIFSEVSGTIRYQSQKRVTLELAVIKLCKPQMETDYESVLDRVRQLEEKLEKGVVVSESSASNDHISGAQDSEDSKKDNTTYKTLSLGELEDIDKAKEMFGDIVKNLDLDILKYLNLRRGIGTDRERRYLDIYFDSNIPVAMLSKQERMDALLEAIGQATGKHIEVNLKVDGHVKSDGVPHIDAGKMTIPLEQID